jgi:acyl carrier protein
LNQELSEWISWCLKGDDCLPTVFERVKLIVVDKLGVDDGDVREESSFVDDLNADSLDLVELIMAFEEEFSTDDQTVEISDDDASNIQTIKDAVNYLREHGVQDS